MCAVVGTILAYQSPRWGAIERDTATQPEADLSIPAMGAIAVKIGGVTNEYISIPAMGGNS